MSRQIGISKKLFLSAFYDLAHAVYIHNDEVTREEKRDNYNCIHTYDACMKLFKDVNIAENWRHQRAVAVAVAVVGRGSELVLDKAQQQHLLPRLQRAWR